MILSDMKIRTLIPALALFFGLSAAAQSGRCLPSRTDGVVPYSPGEKLEFSISYNWHAVQTDVAKADLKLGQETLNGEKVWHSSLGVQTAPFFDVFFKIREKFDSWFALKGVDPRQFHRDSREGDYHAINRYKYDRKAGVIHATLDYRDQGAYTVEIPYGNCTYDVTTLFYFARQMDYTNLKKGNVYRISMAIDEKVSTVNLTYHGQENKYIKGIGTVATRKFGLSVNKGGEVFESGQEVILWFSDDDNRIPVAFMAPLKVGAMNGRLRTYAGLAHPFDAFVSEKKVK